MGDLDVPTMGGEKSCEYISKSFRNLNQKNIMNFTIDDKLVNSESHFKENIA